MLSIYMKPVCDNVTQVVSLGYLWFHVLVSYRSGFIAELAILLHLSRNFVQNKMEQPTSIPPTSPQIKDEAERKAN